MDTNLPAPIGPPTIPSRKQTFLVAQTNVLSQTLTASSAWRNANDASNTPLPPRLVDDALFQLGHMLQQHCRRVYAPQATRNVAEQIASGYTKDAERIIGGREDGNNGIDKEVDLLDEEAIADLPEQWTSAKEIAAAPEAAAEYEASVQRLLALNQRRKQMKQRLERLRELQQSISVLDSHEDGKLQENLVTRNGPVEQELERMRMLLTRVGARVQQLPKNNKRPREPDSKTNGLDDFLENKVFTGSGE